MCSYRVLACTLMTVLMVGRANAQTPGIYGFRDIETRLAMRLAIQGAAARLARPGCQDVLADFDDESGQRLSTKLASSGQHPLDAFGRLRFIDDRRAPRCRWGSTLAFTQTGASSILVCGDRFRLAFRWNPERTEIVIIHEFLHALGLGENPPTSRAITERVNVRCGD